MSSKPSVCRTSLRASGVVWLVASLMAPAACATTHAAAPRNAPGPEPLARPSETAEATPPQPPPAESELPQGGRKIFPDYRLVGFCGTPNAPALGELQGNLPVKAKALVAKAAQYGEADHHKIMPVFELIAVVVQGSPGPDGKYRRRVPDSVVSEYLQLARQFKALLLLNIQPGQSDFLTEVKTFDSFLREPDVGVALDPEWAMTGKHRPGEFWGQTTGQAINSVAELLSSIVQEGNLPEKALIFHEVVKDVVKDELTIKPVPGVVIVKSVDGLGPMHAKIATYGNLIQRTAPGVHAGFKLFFYEDTRTGPIMSAKQVLALSPQPEYVMYE